MKCSNCNNTAEYISKTTRKLACLDCALKYVKMKQSNELNLKVRVSVPKQLVFKFIDDLNRVTNGAAIVEEVK